MGQKEIEGAYLRRRSAVTVIWGFTCDTSKKVKRFPLQHTVSQDAWDVRCAGEEGSQKPTPCRFSGVQLLLLENLETKPFGQAVRLCYGGRGLRFCIRLWSKLQMLIWWHGGCSSVVASLRTPSRKAPRLRLPESFPCLLLFHAHVAKVQASCN